MNKFIFNIKLLSIICIMGIFGSCENYLDQAPQAEINPDEAFKNYRNFQGFTEELYSCIPLFSASDYHNNWNFGEDEYWEPSEARLFANQIDQGNYLAWNTAGYSWFRSADKNNTDYTYSSDRFRKGRLWGLSWYAIRKANVGLQNLDKLIDATEEEKNFLTGQLYFFRAWFHFAIMQFWGGIPYIDREIPSDEVFRLPRLSYQDAADKVAEDFQKAAELLPVDWDATATGTPTKGNNNLRINKIMALAYLGKNLLWAGSPLMKDNPDGSYDSDYCKRAADVFAQVLKLCETSGRYELAPFANYREIFYTENQSGRLPGLKEAIFMENILGANGRFRWNQVNDYRPITINSSGIKVTPTANYVNYYGMANGLPITDPFNTDSESGYDPEYPWRNRDPRFYNDIVIDGEMTSPNSTDNNIKYASLYTGGSYRVSNGAKSMLTGYMQSKFIDKQLTDNSHRENLVVVFSFMRLADVYLMYAEATAVGYGTPQSIATDYTLSAVDAVNTIRQRAGVGSVAAKFLTNTDDFMGELRRERAVELAFEGHRFHDLRRWMLLLQSPYTLKTAIEFDRASGLPANPREARVLNFRYTILRERQFGVKHYWFPFLTDDVTLYKEFKQNPGW